jgi:hypothetical protein
LNAFFCSFNNAASDEIYQLLPHGRWFFPGIPTKTGRHDIAEIGVKHQKSKKSLLVRNINLDFQLIWKKRSCFKIKYL